MDQHKIKAEAYSAKYVNINKNLNSDKKGGLIKDTGKNCKILTRLPLRL